jgi:hypothetical protein
MYMGRGAFHELVAERAVVSDLVTLSLSIGQRHWWCWRGKVSGAEKEEKRMMNSVNSFFRVGL